MRHTVITPGTIQLGICEGGDTAEKLEHGDDKRRGIDWNERGTGKKEFCKGDSRKEGGIPGNVR